MADLRRPADSFTHNFRTLMKQIFNGGIELGILQIVGDENLSEQDKERKAYLESLPKNKWIALDENGLAITDEQAEQEFNKELSRYRIVKS